MSARKATVSETPMFRYVPKNGTPLSLGSWSIPAEGLVDVDDSGLNDFVGVYLEKSPYEASAESDKKE